MFRVARLCSGSIALLRDARVPEDLKVRKAHREPSMLVVKARAALTLSSHAAEHRRTPILSVELYLVRRVCACRAPISPKNRLTDWSI